MIKSNLLLFIGDNRKKHGVQTKKLFNFYHSKKKKGASLVANYNSEHSL